MAIVTGTLTDFGLTLLPGLQPVVIFQADSPGVSPGTVFVDRPIEVVPNSSGAFSVNLQPLDVVRPATFYRVTVKWLDSGGAFIGFNEIPGKLYVTSAGGKIGDLLATEGGAPGLTWVGLTEPPTNGPYTSWLRMDPNNIDDFDPTVGDYYEWS